MGQETDHSLGEVLRPGSALRGFEIGRVLGRGGFGVVYRGHHIDLGSSVAIKEFFPSEVARRIGGTIQPSRSDHKDAYEDGLRRFVDEARRLESFRDCRVIVTLRDLFRANGTAYLVMDFVEGLPLSDLLARREANGQPFTESDLLNVIRPVLEGLQVIHAAGVYHRDIKPSNILIRRSDSQPVLIDFGAAKQVVSGLTKSLAPYTDGYAAMEQVGEGEIGPWTDLYGLGAVMWRMVAGGSPPWTPPNPLTVQRRAYALMQGQEDPMPPAQQIGAGRFTLNLLQTIDACLAVSHSSRLSDCTDLMYALNPEVVEPPAVQPQTTSKAPILAVNRGITTGQKRTPAAASGKGPQNRSYAVWVLVALSLMIVIGIFGYAITRDTAEELFQRGRTSATSPPAATDAPRDTAEELFQRGRTYAEGLGVPQNYREAVRLYRQSADQGNAEAQVSLGNMYSWGRGVSQNDGEAVRLYRQSADQGNAYAQFRLGYMYFWGRGVPQNYREAVRLYRLSADQGNAYAQFRLGYMYFWGRGVPQNDREAVRWYRLSAEKGLGRAQTNLGLMYVNGRGVIRDYIRAYAWLNLAAAAGHYVAAQSRSDVSSMMTAGQIAEAQRLSAELLDAEE